MSSEVAQLVVRSAVNREDAGSNPALGASFLTDRDCGDENDAPVWETLGPCLNCGEPVLYMWLGGAQNGAVIRHHGCLSGRVTMTVNAPRKLGIVTSMT